MNQSLRCALAVGLTLTLSFVLPATSFANGKTRDISITPIGTYSAKVFDEGAAEIVAHDPETQRLFVVNGASSAIDVLSIVDPTNPTLVFSIDVTPYGRQANSVDVSNGVVAAAVEANVKTDPGQVVFFDTDGAFLNAVTVGALPDMLTFSPNGRIALVANEAEPNDSYTIDPEGSVSIIDLTRGASHVLQSDVTTAGFGFFELLRPFLDPSVRIFGPNATLAQDFEPEYITVSHDSKFAWVTLQENNALAILDLRLKHFVSVQGLGFKNHNLPGNGLDASDRDNAINIANWPVFGLYLPDAIASFKVHGDTYLITANEGDAREYAAFTEERRVSSLTLDPLAFPNATTLRANANIGRLNVTNTLGDTDGDGDFDRLFALGGRSFSIRKTTGELIFDSGDQIEHITASASPSFFNASNTNNTRDDRSDNKGPEPEGLTVAKLFGRTYAFIGLERIGGVLVYDLSEPDEPRFVQYVNNRNFAIDPETGTVAGTVGDLGPEGLHVIAEDDSPNGEPLLVVANEISGTTTIYQISKVN
jgi:hypothetical protein